MSNHEINYILRKEPHFQGVFMLDENLPLDGCYVLNLDNSDSLGTHWVCVYFNEYYDPFGLPPPEKLNGFLFSRVQHQRVGSTLCGLYCCFYIWARNRNVSRYDLCYNVFKHNGNKKLLLSWIDSIASNVKRKP